jgi:predicted porin
LFAFKHQKTGVLQMKKQLLAAAVATAIAAPMAASADVTVYGLLHYSIDSYDLDNNTAGAWAGTGSDALATGYDGSAVNSHTSRFGIKGSEDLGNGLSAVFQMEFDISGDDLGGVNNNRNTYVALAGSWGVAGIGQVDTPFKSSTASLDIFNEQVGDNNQLFFDDVRAQDAVFYMSPNWNGFSFVGAVVIPSRDNDADGIEATSIAAMYSNGPWYASLAYEDISGEYVDALYSGVGAVTDGMDYDKWRLGLGWTANGWHVGFIYEDREIDNLDTLGLDNDGESWQLSASYTAGNNTFKVAYGEADGAVNSSGATFNVDDAEAWSIGIDHKLSNRTKVYAAYADYNDDGQGGATTDNGADVLSLGIVHTF